MKTINRILEAANKSTTVGVLVCMPALALFVLFAVWVTK